ncbi:hypothetical protein ACG7TL_007316 [Trametes sanguinea]
MAKSKELEEGDDGDEGAAGTAQRCGLPINVNSSTKQTPFYANLGYHPTFDPLITPPSVTVPAAGDIAQCLTRIHNECRAQLLTVQNR